MNISKLSYDKIIDMVENHTISPQEGLRFLKALQKKTGSVNFNQDIRYYQSVWKESFLDKRTDDVKLSGDILLFNDDTDIGQKIKESFSSTNFLDLRLTIVSEGKAFQKIHDHAYLLNPEEPDDYHKLLDHLHDQQRLPNIIIHIWSQDKFVFDENLLKDQLKKSFYSVFYLCQNLLRLKDHKKIQFLYLYKEDQDYPQPVYSALSGFSKTINHENSKIQIKIISLNDFSKISKVILTEIQTKESDEVLYKGDSRFIKQIEEIKSFSQSHSSNLLKQNGVYLLTGGAGGLGLIFSKFLAESLKARLVLVGRSSLSEEKLKKIHELESSGAKISYFKGDVCKKEDVDQLMLHIKSQYGEINGIIHCAGNIKDSYLVKKSDSDMEHVLGPKIFGAINLDEATCNEPLDFFVLFSSVSAVTGNPGQCDYAYANSFLDHFSLLRENLRQQNRRYGKTLSINWPLWREGGMQVDKQTEEFLKKTVGIKLLENSDGLEAFSMILSSEKHQVMVMKGEIKPCNHVKGESFEQLQKDILIIVSEILIIDSNEMDLNEDISEYGFDSISFTEFANRINEKFDLEITPALFFEYTTIHDFSKFLFDTYFNVSQTDTHQPMISHEFTSTDYQLNFPVENSEISLPDKKPIAIIGMSGVMPGSADLDIFWKHLEASDDLVTEVPHDRWDLRFLNNQPLNQYLKWGGFIPEIDKFDPLFFGISPREAEFMDPQQRIFIETVWKTIEDAGYKASDLSGTKTGLFVGVSTNDYADLLKEHISKTDVHAPTGTSHCVLANRVSYLLNLHGPSEPIDTACSSSLVANHRAVEAINSGSCDMAIAGGVNAMLTPGLTVAFNQAGMLSPDGRCKTFDKSADGYVRGEGVGALLLKPLDKAIADGDHIYAVIKGTGENHGGKAASLTAPNPKAQSALLIDIYEKSGINPDTISYIEAHGTGTVLGDPIEINGLKNAFKELFKRKGITAPVKPFCAIGSVKTNIGHLEAAAGISSIIKVLLALKHKKLPANLHFKEINPYIQLQGSPFYIVENTIEWKQLQDDAGNLIPRRAGISGFGFGGANAHIVLEEYEEPKTSSRQLTTSNHEPVIIILSAKSEERLKVYASRLAVFLGESSLSLSDIAYTLQVGRESMEERLALIVYDVDELINKLYEFSNGEYNSTDNIFYGSIKSGQNKSGLILQGRAGREFLNIIIEEKDFIKIAQLWISGIEIDWGLLYQGKTLKRVSLPSYPFARERHWLPEKEKNLKSEYITNHPKYPESFYFKSIWEKSDIDIKTEKKRLDNIVILFDTNESRYNILSKRLSHKAILVKPGKVFSANDHLIYEINPESEEDYDKLFASLIDQKIFPDTLLHLWNLNSEKKIKIDPVSSIFYFLKTVLKRKYDKLSSIYYFFSLDTDDPIPFKQAVSGYSKSIKFILPYTSLYSIQISEDRKESHIEDLIINELNLRLNNFEYEIKYDGNSRYVKKIRPIELSDTNDLNIRKGGVYLITGGAGGLGLIFTTYLAQKFDARLVLTGRSPLSVEKAAYVKELNKKGSEILYVQADVSDLQEMTNVFHTIKQKFGTLNGIIHAAGISSSNLLFQKDWKEFESTLKPKISGTINLDIITKDEPLDFFILFSSLSAILGDFGQCDYAISNRFLDAFATYRERLRKKNERSGKTISINWPLWREGGLHMNAEMEKFYLQTSGMSFVETKAGIVSFEKILSCSYEQVILISGDPERVGEIAGKRSEESSGKYAAGSEKKQQISYKLQSELKKLISSILKISADRLNVSEGLANFGFESITLKLFSDKLSETYGITIPPSIFFAHNNIMSLCEYILKNFEEQIIGYYGVKEEEDKILINCLNQDGKDAQDLQDGTSSECSINRYPVHPANPGYPDSVAIIGMHGIFPGSNNLSEFWHHLENEHDLITEVPKSRWNWEDYVKHDENGNSYQLSATSYQFPYKWGGFIEDADKFDPMFFNISPREAEAMDPQHRLFIETVWKTVEDAGYKVSALSGKAVGVFAGVQFNDYQQLILINNEGNERVGTGTADAMLANRVSYLMNWRGPSISIDTACSGSLVAVHMAVKSIQNGESELAIAGGVSLALSPLSMIGAGILGVLSPDGKCKTLDKNANGYVKGEGIGAVLLKSLSKAIADHDNIYAIIKGSAVNHGGKAHSLTAPNSEAQAALLVKAFREAKIDPETVTYMELHGTGTELGDPVEIDGLKKAFQELSRLKNLKIQKSYYCGLGSVKTNIGHLEPAAGIAGLIKIVLSMKNEKIPGLLHFKELNQYIELKDTPFYVVNKTKTWERLKDENDDLIPRRSGISSFGFGGANAHVLLEEYFEESNQFEECVIQQQVIIILSAKNEERLKAYVKEFLDYFDDEILNNNKISLSDIAYTLQVGREAMEERVAVLVSDIDELKEKLSEYGNKEFDTEKIFKGNVKNFKAGTEILIDGREGEEFVKIIIDDKKLSKLAHLWVSGLEINWELLYPHHRPKRISLPAYPFEKKSYWLPKSNTHGIIQKDLQVHNIKIHPFLDQNRSTLEEQKFTTLLTGKEFYLTDHVVAGQKTFPGAAYIEMARAALEASGEKRVKKLANIVWSSPITINDKPQEVSISLFPDKGRVEFEVYTIGPNGNIQIHAQGKITYEDNISQVFKPIDIASIKNRCIEKRKGEECYQGFKHSGLDYGHSFQVIEELCSNQSEAFANLMLPKSLHENFKDFVLHPSILDGALQSVCGIFSNIDKQNPYIPFTLGEITIIKPLTDKCYAYAVKEGSSGNSDVITFRIDILNESGEVLVHIKDFSLRALKILKNGGKQIDPETLTENSELRNEHPEKEYIDRFHHKNLLQNLQKDLISILADILKTDEQNIDLQKEMSGYGFDSISFTAFANQINSRYGLEILPTIFFEYPSIEAFSLFLVKTHHDYLQKFYEFYSDSGLPESKSDSIKLEASMQKRRFKSSFIHHINENLNVIKSSQNMPIAIIGMSCRMPQSENKLMFWKHLEKGDDLITTVPKDRWDWEAIYGDPLKEPNKTYAKWGGFIDHVDKFDPLFFGISPREAEVMDPQQRLFLEIVWETIEDSGYKPSDFYGTDTGLFVGVATDDYSDLLKMHSTEVEVLGPTGTAHSVLANRISYILNLHGPSEPIDTACSSSLVAIHKACEAIQSESCDAAIAGGVNVILTPVTTIAVSMAGMLAQDGRCKTFDKKADGYVRGEGVGAILLKPLDRAIADNDHIYAVIKGTGENHGGRAASLTSPNPKAQAKLLVRAYEKANISPDTVSYIETHGTGTSLGDPIEINALKMAFGALYKKFNKDLPHIPHCGLGSVKTNIGHLEAASGIASIIKVLLSMKYKKLPQNINFQELNPYIKLEDTPFYILTKSRTWQPLEDDQGNAVPRRAGISSFGFGGANAHIILEEYVDAKPATSNQQPVIIFLSAKNEERLYDYARQMVAFLDSKVSEFSLSDMAYTLQIGRESMEERLAVVVSDENTLREKLSHFISHKKNIENLFTGNIRQSRSVSKLMTDSDEGNDFINSIIKNEKLYQLAQLWVTGIKFDWKLLYKDSQPKRIPLPSYPFAKERYWISLKDHKEVKEINVLEKLTVQYLHITWKQSQIEKIPNIELASSPILLFDIDESNHNKFLLSLKQDIILVKPGEKFEIINHLTYTLNPENIDDYKRLSASLQEQNKLPSHIIHLWSQESFNADLKTLNGLLKRSVFSILYLSQSLMEYKAGNKINLLYFYLEPSAKRQPVYAALSGFAKTIRHENPNYIYKTISVQNLSNIADIAASELQSIDSSDIDIRYHEDKRYTGHIEDLKFESIDHNDANLFIENGAYLISGGAGGLGLIFAEFITRKVKARLFLTGRSELNDAKLKKIQSFKDHGSEVFYIKADVSIKTDVEKLYDQIKSKCSKLNGIIHCAGIIKDSYILKKREETFFEVLAPKIFGTINLDEVFQNEFLDFYILFSSTTSITGNPGQSDYAYANRFLDHFAALREKLRIESKRFGKTVSINWPLWEEGGMHISKEALEFIFAKTGFKSLPTDKGIKAFENIVLKSEIPQCMVVYGQKDKIDIILGKSFETNMSVDKSTDIPLLSSSLGPDENLKKTIDLLKKILSDVLKLSSEKIDINTSVEEYGIDSILINRFNTIMETVIPNLPKTLLFEYQTINELAKYLVKSHEPELVKISATSHEPRTTSYELPATSHKLRATSHKPPATSHEPRATSHELPAIIGVSGRYPLSKNLDEFWENLKDGKECIAEVPKSRWDYNDFYDPDSEKSKLGKIYCKWGGFIDDADKFDPLFFNISAREAELMDPQERIFLETVWSTIEDAGYTRNRLKGYRVGVFAGVTTNTYSLWGPEIWRYGNASIPTSMPWSISNRVSYFFNFHGPSLTIDTACSSSLIAVHMACESLKNKECDFAVAGGINLYLHPAKYLQLCQSRMLSSTRHCKSFSSEADGFIPGEGSGAVLLTNLNQAISSCDRIYAIIKGSSTNHGGKTTGYTVPNPIAQADLISEAIKKSKINPREISYIEAHGTATSLGDPVEIRGLTKAYEEFTQDRQYCSIGSVKSNIGHLESAAGIAGLTKIILQLKYKQIVPSLHTESLNPNINFKDSPFYIQNKLADWNPLLINENGTERKVPRRAAISSFGAGGANAHIILEEYDGKPKPATNNQQPEIIVLSARNEERLKVYAMEMIEFLEKSDSLSLSDIAFTLQCGREAMNDRLAMVVTNVDEMIQRLRDYLKSRTESENLFTGNVKREKTKSDLLIEGEDGRDFINNIITNRKLNKIARFWVSGTDIDWKLLNFNKNRDIISLPTYPFAKERYWVPIYHEKETSKSQIQEFQNPECLYFQTFWEKFIIYNVEKNNIKEKSESNSIILFDSDNIRIESLSDKLSKKIILVKPGDSFIENDNLIYQINPTKEDDYIKLIKSITNRNLYPEIAIYLWGINSPDDFCKNIKNISSVFYFIKAISQTKYSTLSNFLFIFNAVSDLPNPVLESVSGFSKSLKFIFPKLFISSIQLTESDHKTKSIEEIITQELNLLQNNPSHEILYKGEERYIRKVKQIWLSDNDKSILKQNGVYLITGGAGGLGLIFAKFLATNYRANLVLTGRSSLNQKKVKEIDALKKSGADVLYIKGDVSDSEQMTDMVKTIKARFGQLNGIIHAAGIPSPHVVMEKDWKEFENILRPKVNGALILNQVTQSEHLDFFVMFSSSSAILGDFGQCDYAVANRFLDAFVQYREMLRAKNKCFGKTISINWPLWREGGFHMDEETEQLYIKSSGMAYLETDIGLKSFERVLANPYDQVMLLVGDPKRIEYIAGTRKHIPAKIFEKQVYENKNNGKMEFGLQEKTIDYVKTVFSNVLKIKKEAFDINDTFEMYGIDSIAATEIVKKFEEVFGKLSITLLFEYMTIELLAKYFITAHTNRLNELFNFNSNKITKPDDIYDPVNDTIIKKHQGNISNDNKIAIIGMSGRYPMSETLDDFWENLKKGKNCIREIPEDRWNWHEFGQDIGIYTKWGGFIDDADKFDPSFFGISEKEAGRMDPQERLFLETSWSAFEDAGYTRKTLKKVSKNAGVFVGVTNCTYEFLSGEAYAKGNINISCAEFWSVANRVSYHFNFGGPSIAIDTSCSSSLTAVHLACESLLRGECQIAVAGGVNLIFHPQHYLMLCFANKLAKDNKCRSFGDDADGFVAAEGVGAVILKPLDQAIADKDQIYGVILGSSMNFGGKTSGYRMVNPTAQADLIIDAIKKADINPRTISYVEGQGIAGLLADAIEITGLTKAYREYTDDRQYCNIGSVKSNIGHPESAGGIAGLTKVLLQMKQKKLVPSINSEKLNPHIDFTDSPFHLQHDLSEWKQPVIVLDGNKKIYPRRAAISGFGGGGTNVHIILEEYDNEEIYQSSLGNEQYLIILSAKNKVRLKACIENLAKFLGNVVINDKNNLISLADIAHTLQSGREHMEERFAVIVTDIDSLLGKLNQYLDGDHNREDVYIGSVKQNTSHFQNKETDLRKIASLWVNGTQIEWESLYPDKKVKRISLPSYPFAKERYWLPETEDITNKTKDRSIVMPRNALEAIICLMWEEILNIRPISVTDNFFELGGKSVQAIQLMGQIYERFGKNLPLAALINNQSLENFTSFILNDIDKLPWQSLVLIKKGGLRPPFYCIPGIGGNVHYLYYLAKYLGNDLPFYGFQAIGLDGKSEPHKSIEEMATNYISSIQTVQKNGPYLLGGHSLGARVVYEMAMQLQNMGQETEMIVIFDCTAPPESLYAFEKNPDSKYLYDDAYLLCEIAGISETYQHVKLNVLYDELTKLNLEEKLDYIIEKYRQSGLLASYVSAEQLKGLVNVYKAGRKIRYSSKPKANPFKIVLFKAVDCNPDLFEEPEIIVKDPTWGWSRFSSKPVEIFEIPGDHNSMMAEPNVKMVAEKLAKILQ